MAPKKTLKELKQAHARTQAELEALEAKYEKRYSQDAKDALERQAHAERDYEGPWERWREAGRQAKASQDRADQLERDFKQSGDKATGEKAGRAREVAKMDRQNEADATKVYETAEQELSKARADVRKALRNDPAHEEMLNDPKYKSLNEQSQEEAGQIHQREVVDGEVSLRDGVDDDETQVAAASTEEDVATFLSDADAGVGDEGDDPDLTSLRPDADLDGGTSRGSLSVGQPAGDGSADTGDDTRSPFADETSDVEPEPQLVGADTSDQWAEMDQSTEAQVAVADPPAEPEFEEFADDGAGTPS